MSAKDNRLPEIVSREAWIKARKAMREQEKEFAGRREALTDKRRRMPVTEMNENLTFKGPNGRLRLIDLFENRRQLLVYHFWFEPGHDPCEGCSMWTRDLGDLGGDFAHLHNNNTSFVYVSRASQSQIAAVKNDRGWTMPWYSVTDEDFHAATGYAGWAQISVFLRDGDTAYLANMVPMNDLVTIGNHWTLLERTPLGLSQV